MFCVPSPHARNHSARNRSARSRSACSSEACEKASSLPDGGGDEDECGGKGTGWYSCV